MKEPCALTTDIARIIEIHARGSVLRYLLASPMYTLNANVLRDLLDHDALHLSEAGIISVLAWLNEHQLVRTEVRSVLVASLLQAGSDVAEDRKQITGVARPDPQ